MKRGSRKPEKASTRPPAKPKSSWPDRDTRAPRGRGKGGSPLSTGDAKRAGGTSLSGKPTGDGDPAAIPSSEAPRKRGPKPADPEQLVPRKLSKAEIAEREKRLWSKYGEKRKIEREKKRITADLSRDITALAKELDKLHDEIESGYEQIKQGELPFDASPEEIQAGAATPTVGQTDAALAEIARHVGANGEAKDAPHAAPFDFTGDEPAPAIDGARAGATRIEAERVEA